MELKDDGLETPAGQSQKVEASFQGFGFFRLVPRMNWIMPDFPGNPMF